MRYSWSDLPALCRTPIGRAQIRKGILRRTWPVLSRAAALYRRTRGRHSRVVAVVGSFGKTTTARAVSAALGREVALQTGSNAYESIARRILQIRPDDRHTVVEAGISEPGQMAAYARVVQPDITVVTWIGNSHQQALHTFENTRHEKAEMVRILPVTGLAVLNGDDPHVRWMATQTRAPHLTFGLEATNDVWASEVTLDVPHGTLFRLHLDGQTYDLRVRLLGRHMVYPILAAIATAHAEGRAPDVIFEALTNLPPTHRRLETIRLPNNITLLLDDNKGALESVYLALDVFTKLPAHRRIVVLHEPVDDLRADEEVFPLLGERLAETATHVFFMGTQARFEHLRAGARRGGLSGAACTHIGVDVVEALRLLQHLLEPGDAVLIKGPSSTRLFRIALGLQGRTVRCEAPKCDARLRCPTCPMLERGWGNRRIVI